MQGNSRGQPYPASFSLGLSGLWELGCTPKFALVIPYPQELPQNQFTVDAHSRHLDLSTVLVPPSQPFFHAHFQRSPVGNLRFVGVFSVQTGLLFSFLWSSFSIKYRFDCLLVSRIFAYSFIHIFSLSLPSLLLWFQKGSLLSWIRSLYNLILQCRLVFEMRTLTLTETDSCTWITNKMLQPGFLPTAGFLTALPTTSLQNQKLKMLLHFIGCKLEKDAKNDATRGIDKFY